MIIPIKPYFMPAASPAIGRWPNQYPTFGFFGCGKEISDATVFHCAVCEWTRVLYKIGKGQLLIGVFAAIQTPQVVTSRWQRSAAEGLQNLLKVFQECKYIKLRWEDLEGCGQRCPIWQPPRRSHSPTSRLSLDLHPLTEFDEVGERSRREEEKK